MILMLLVVDDAVSIAGLVFSTLAFRTLEAADVAGASASWLRGVLIAEMAVLGASLVYSLPEFLVWAFVRSRKAVNGSLACDRHGDSAVSVSGNIVCLRTLRSSASMLIFTGAGVMLGLTLPSHLVFELLQCPVANVECRDAESNVRVVLWLNLVRLCVKYSQSVVSHLWMAWQTECHAAAPAYSGCV